MVKKKKKKKKRKEKFFSVTLPSVLFQTNCELCGCRCVKAGNSLDLFLIILQTTLRSPSGVQSCISIGS